VYTDLDQAEPGSNSSDALLSLRRGAPLKVPHLVAILVMFARSVAPWALQRVPDTHVNHCLLFEAVWRALPIEAHSVKLIPKGLGYRARCPCKLSVVVSLPIVGMFDVPSVPKR
jgi:predicted Kef-type K+ transport protein